MREVSVDYFTAMKIPLVRGPIFYGSGRRESSARRVIINQTLANLFFHTENPSWPSFAALCRQTNQPAIEIVGVAGDEKLGPLDQPTTPIVYDSLLQDASRTVSLVVRTGCRSKFRNRSLR